MLKKLWKKIVEKTYPWSYEEYLECKEIRKIECKKCFKRPQYLIGFFFFFVFFFIIIYHYNSWFIKIILIFFILSISLMMDVVLKHFCFLLNKERKKINNGLKRKRVRKMVVPDKKI